MGSAGPPWSTALAAQLQGRDPATRLHGLATCRWGVVVVLGGSVIHAGALEVVSRAHGVLLLQCGTTQRVSLLSQSDKGLRPGARVTILNVATGCEHLANGRTHVVCYSEAPEQLEGRN